MRLQLFNLRKQKTKTICYEKRNPETMNEKTYMLTYARVLLVQFSSAANEVLRLHGVETHRTSVCRTTPSRISLRFGPSRWVRPAGTNKLKSDTVFDSEAE